MEAEEELEVCDATRARAAQVLAIQQQMQAAALEVASMTKLVLQPAGKDVADTSDQANATEEALGAAEAEDVHGHDALTRALTELKRALEHRSDRERADAEARWRAEREALEEREKFRATLEAAMHGKQEALEGQQEEVKRLQGAVARLQVFHILKSQLCGCFAQWVH
jgi:hypothetical protein